MEQDIDKIINDLEMALLTDLYGHITTLVKKEDLEHLIKAYKELEEENKELKECLEVTSKALDNVAYDQIPIAIADLMIPKALVEEKIEEIKGNIPYLSKFSDWEEENYTNEDMINEEILVLQELLEKR